MFNLEEILLFLVGALLLFVWLGVVPLLGLIGFFRSRSHGAELARLRKLLVEGTAASRGAPIPSAVPARKTAAAAVAEPPPRAAGVETAEHVPTSLPPTLAAPEPRSVPVPAATPAPEAFWIEPAASSAKTAPEPVLAARDVEARPVAVRPTGDESSTLEELLAGKWLTWVGAVAVVIGVGFFLKYSIDQGWIGPTARIAIGLLTGMATFAGGAFATLRSYRWLGQGLVGAALGILYFSFFAAFGWMDPQVLRQTPAFAGMVLTTAAALGFAVRFEAQSTAILGLLGGLLTPVMLSTGQDAQWTLFSYVLLLDLGVLGVATYRKWPALQILAFAGTLVVWIGWFDRHYAPEKLQPTLILMTAHFVLFALLGVWHNVIRRVPAKPGDFVLILATPVAYFVGLYGVTTADYAFLQGLLAIGLAGGYLALGLFALTKHPQGRKVIVALGGVAASFLTVAIPLQLTGHWIAVAWAAEALLLVELGLRFRETKLRIAGFVLLGVVQFILVSYTLQTIDDPRGFDSRFNRPAPEVTYDPITGDYVEPIRPEPTWTDVVNGRSLTFLASAIVFGVLAWEYRYGAGRSVVDEARAQRGAKGPDAAAAWLDGAALAAVPLTLGTMLVLETFVAAQLRDWLLPSFLSWSIAWIGLAAVALAGLGTWVRPRWLHTVSLVVFGLLALFVAGQFLGTLGGWRFDWARIDSLEAKSAFWPLFVLNPRGLGFLAAIAAAVAGAWIVQRAASLPGEDPESEDGRSAGGGRLSDLATGGLVLFAWGTGLALLTIETYAQGVVRKWSTETLLYVTFVWTAYAIATMAFGIVRRSALARRLSLLLFLATTAKVFLLDVWRLDATIRTLAFVGLGVSLLLVSFLYRRFRRRIREFMTPTSLLLAAALPVAGALSAGTASAAGPVVLGRSLVLAVDSKTPAEPEAPLPTTFPDRWPLVVPGDVGADAALVRVAVPDDVYGSARPDLGDLRLLAITDRARPDFREIPYVVFVPQDSVRTEQRPATLLNLATKDGRTRFVVDPGPTADPVNELTIEIGDASRNYERSVRAWGGPAIEGDDWSLLTDKAYVLDVTRPGHRLTVRTIRFPQSRFRAYRVEIDDRGEAPLAVTGVRLVDEVRTTAPRREHDCRIESHRTDAKEKTTFVVLDTGHARLPTDGLALEVEFPGPFHRPVQIEAADELAGDRTQWRSVAADSLWRIDRPGLKAENLKVAYGETRARYLRVAVRNGDDAPLTVRRATARGIERALVVEARRLREAGTQDVALYAGRERLGPPQYDLARTIDATGLERGPAVTLGSREPNPFFQGTPQPKRPWSEENQPLLWSLTIAGIVVFGALTVLLLRKAAATGSGTSDGDEPPRDAGANVSAG